MGMGTVVIGHSQLGQPAAAGLFDQLNRVEAAIAAKGMAVKITDVRAAFRTDGFEDRP